MKIAISNIAWDKENDNKIYEFLKKNNVKYLEVAPIRLIEQNPYNMLDEAKKISEQLKNKYGLNICSMQSIWFGKKENIFENEKSFNSLLEYTKKAIDFACSVGCPNLVFGCPKGRNMSNYDIDYPKALIFFKKIGEYAQDNDVVISLEPNPEIYNTNFLNNTKEAIKFIKELKLPNIKINYDLGTVIYNKEDINLLRNNLSLVNHIHISEPNLEVIVKRNIHSELFKILRELNYDKCISIEMKKTTINNVKRVIKYISGLNEV